MTNYNRVTWIYELLGRIVFGNKLELANQAYLDKISIDSKVLVVGGGNGKIIEYLNDLGYSIAVDYVELSPRMMYLARKQKNYRLSVRYFNSPIEDFKGSDYNFIITNFFFDQFNPLRSKVILGSLRTMLTRDGLLILNDFNYSENRGDRLLIYIMIKFFRFSTGIEANELPLYSKILNDCGFINNDSFQISRNIRASLYSTN